MAKPRTEHTYTELRFVGLRGDGGAVATYGAPSASEPRRTNLVGIDKRTGAITCNCPHCTHHPNRPASCWLAREVAKAEYARTVAPVVAGWGAATMAARERACREAAAAGTASAMQRVLLDVIGDEWARRGATAAAAA